MVKLRILLFILFSGIGLAQAQLSPKEITLLKANMVKAIESSKLTDSLFKSLDKLPNKTALITGYTGTLQALKAKHSWNPYNKIKFVSRSLKTMQKAIDMDKENMEIRFMRFSIEFYTPSFLGFSKDLATDKKEIVKHYQNENFGMADRELVRNVAKFMIDSKRCTAAEINVFKKHL
ncbi:hypothetical protein [Pedobacter kyungheensis]|uniref:hypothetical protein n=1 Tax=Pedobacter kyungheensis TaxID=1069985 RepID=UPI000690AB48|nr:hypothetical protein [Pedobacter kyungheensis]